MEYLLRLLFVEVILLIGITVRWTFLNTISSLRSKPTITYTQFRRRFVSSNDPSNSVSNHVIHLFLGFAITFVVVFGIVLVLS